MNRKFEYAKLTVAHIHGKPCYYLNRQLITRGGKGHTSLVSALNFLGDLGWQVSTRLNEENYLLMREI